MKRPLAYITAPWSNSQYAKVRQGHLYYDRPDQLR